MSGIEDLRQRVQDAEQHFGLAREEQAKYSTRLIGLIDEVEGRLRAQQVEIERQQAILADIGEEAAKEREYASRFERENEQLRAMLHSLLHAIETGTRGNFSEIMHVLDEKVSALISGSALSGNAEAPEAPEPIAEPVNEPVDEVSEESKIVAEPESEPGPFSEPELAADPEPEMAVDPVPEIVAEPEAVAGPEPEMVVDPEPEPVAEPEAATMAEPEMAAEAEPEIVTETEAVAESEPEMAADTESLPVAEPDAIAEVVSEMTAEPEQESVSESEAVAEPEPEMIAAAAPEPEMAVEAEVEEAAVSPAEDTVTVDNLEAAKRELAAASNVQNTDSDSLHEIMDRVSRLVREAEADDTAAPPATPAAPAKKSAAG